MFIAPVTLTAGGGPSGPSRVDQGRSPGSTRQRKSPRCSRRATEPHRRSQSTGVPSGSEAATGVVTKLDLRDGYEIGTTPCRVCSVRRPPRSRSTARTVVRRRLGRTPEAHRPLGASPILESFPIGASPSSGGRRGGRGRVGRRSFGHVALAPGSRDERRRDDPGRSDLGRPCRRLRQDLDEPEHPQGNPDLWLLLRLL